MQYGCSIEAGRGGVRSVHCRPQLSDSLPTAGGMGEGRGEGQDIGMQPWAVLCRQRLIQDNSQPVVGRVCRVYQSRSLAAAAGGREHPRCLCLVPALRGPICKPLMADRRQRVKGASWTRTRARVPMPYTQPVPAALAAVRWGVGMVVDSTSSTPPVDCAKCCTVHGAIGRHGGDCDWNEARKLQGFVLPRADRQAMKQVRGRNDNSNDEDEDDDDDTRKS